MRSYGVRIGGVEEPGARWAHWPRGGESLPAPRATRELEARLERGESPPDAERVMAGRVALSTSEQGVRALAAARAAQPAWARTPLADRLEFMRSVYEEVTDRHDEILDVLVAEGHPVRLARWELASVACAFHPESVAALAAQLHEERTLGGRRTRLVRRPDGVVCLSPPGRAPTSRSFAGALVLAAGNALVVNAPPTAPLGVAYVYAEIVGPLLARHGAPPGVLSVVCAPVRTALRQWLESPDCDDVYFFGSSDQGLRLERECVLAGKKPVLETSGADGVLVWRDAEADLAARALAERFYGSGQLPSTPAYAVVHPAVADRLLKELAESARAIRPGPPEDPETVLTPVAERGEFTALVREAVDGGAELVVGGELVDLHGEGCAAGPFAQPTVVRVHGLAAAERLRAVREETCAPLLCVVVPEADADDRTLLDETLAFLDRAGHGVRNSLWARDDQVIDRFCDEVGGCAALRVNDSHLGPLPVLPVGGGLGGAGGILGEAGHPAVRTSRLQTVSLATGVAPRARVFDHASSAWPGAARGR
ncbi:aldehyde dehydrogenase [Streptomyces sp. NPDC051907]|uniref:aldehyde dehydrogenase family protein n=1 Tax=Streptomyces sp. NPDC051907 TaxID=3155284 RepID=UPI00342BC362